MGAFSADTNLMVQALVRHAKAQPGGGKPYLTSLQSAAMAAVMGNGDEYAVAVSHAGGSTSWMREVPANIIAQLCELGIQVLEAEEAAAADGVTGLPGSSVLYADFSKRPCNIG